MTTNLNHGRNTTAYLPRTTGKLVQLACAAGLAFGLSACAQGTDNSASTLAEVVVPDADFTFATSRKVSLEVQVGATPEMIEISDSEGRRLMQGAFVNSTTIDLEVPVGRASSLTIRAGQNEDAVERAIEIGANDRAVLKL